MKWPHGLTIHAIHHTDIQISKATGSDCAICRSTGGSPSKHYSHSRMEAIMVQGLRGGCVRNVAREVNLNLFVCLLGTQLLM